MADKDQLQLIIKSVESWNKWRLKHRGINIDLSDANLSGVDFNGANLRGADFSEANLNGADLSEASLNGAILSDVDLSGATLMWADLMHANLSHANLNKAILMRADLSGADLSNVNLSGADLSGADLSGANLSHANLMNADLNSADFNKSNLSEADFRGADFNHAKFRGADLSGANLSGVDLSGRDLSGADLRNANLERAIFVGTNLSNAILEGCRVYGVSAWSLILDGANQKNLRITPKDEPSIRVDDLEVAQFIYLMLNNQKVRNVINTITTKAVLILGRFTKERKAVLDAIREELRQQDYLPIMFDFDQPATRDMTETISTLAHMARFIIADITDPQSVPQELYAIVPHLSVPVKPLLLASGKGYALSNDLKKYSWFLETHIYESSEQLVAELKEKVIAPAEAKAKELRA